jgi:hypothetical protein
MTNNLHLKIMNTIKNLPKVFEPCSGKSWFIIYRFSTRARVLFPTSDHMYGCLWVDLETIQQD